MGEPLAQAATRLVECCALVAIGYQLRQAGVLKASDGETAVRLAATLTTPSLIVQAMAKGGPLGASSLSLVGVAAVCVGAQVAAAWLYASGRSPRERAVLAGSSSGGSLGLWAYPLADAFLAGPCGAAAVQAVALADLVNHVAVHVGSYLLSASAGPAFPAAFAHEDGGVYRGQWRGLAKEGLGVYTYPSGARYEGEWRSNVKEGRGVYHFPKGGVYEGEFAGGAMSGLGVRTLASGQVQAGRWREGRLDAPLELWQVALAADGAAAVAAAARSVEVGGGRLADAAAALAAQPTAWALAAGLCVALARVPLPAALDAPTAALAAANAPLCLLAAGLTAPPLAPPQGLQQRLTDFSRLLAARLLVPLVAGSCLLLLAAAGGGAAVGPAAVAAAGGAVAEAGALVPLAGLLLALLCPVPPQALANARRFRLNESTAAALSAASHLVCVPLALAAAAAATACGLASPAALASCGGGGAGAAVAMADARPLLAFTAAAIAAVTAGVSASSRLAAAEQGGDGGGGGARGWWHGGLAAALAGGGGGGTAAGSESQRVLMVYAGPVGSQRLSSPQGTEDAPGASAAASGAAATSAPAPAPLGGPAAGVGDGGGGAAAADGASGSGASGSGASGGGGAGGSGGGAGGGARPGAPGSGPTAAAAAPWALRPWGAASCGAPCRGRLTYGGGQGRSCGGYGGTGAAWPAPAPCGAARRGVRGAVAAAVQRGVAAGPLPPGRGRARAAARVGVAQAAAAAGGGALSRRQASGRTV